MYKQMAQGLPPLDANIMDLQTDIPEDEEDWEAELPPNFALIHTLGTELKSFNDALSRPHANEWQTMLDYEISQLEKLGTWVMENLLKGHNVILCSTMLKEKHSPDDKITSYQVCIVAGGHKQAKRVNYSPLQQKCLPYGSYYQMQQHNVKFICDSCLKWYD